MDCVQSSIIPSASPDGNVQITLEYCALLIVRRCLVKDSNGCSLVLREQTKWTDCHQVTKRRSARHHHRQNSSSEIQNKQRKSLVLSDAPCPLLNWPIASATRMRRSGRCRHRENSELVCTTNDFIFLSNLALMQSESGTYAIPFNSVIRRLISWSNDFAPFGKTSLWEET